MTTSELRDIAVSAVRSHLRKSGLSEQEIASVSMRSVEGALDEIQRAAPDTLAAKYYAIIQEDDSLAEWKRFKREWKRGAK